MKKLILPIILFVMFIPFAVNAEPLSVTDCDNNTLSTTVSSNLKGLAKIMAKNAYLDNGKSEYVSSCSGVSFNAISSDTNGKGIYEIASTKNDTYPIYYYRGAVDNNNVKFAGFCWKAIRTTDTGGVKMIYNGEPDSSGNCTNRTGTDTRIGKSKFNSSYTSLADVGYMYGTRYTYSSKSSSNLATAYVYGGDVTYSGGTYTLTDTMTSTGTWNSDYNTLNNNHYTCFSTGTTCTSVYYIYHTSSLYAYYITLSNGKKVEDALDEMFNGSNVNANSSTAKTQIDNWYNSNLSSYTNYIEDTIYCNDRSISELNGWNPDGGDTTKRLYFSPYTRTLTNYAPNLACSRILDRFTVSSSKGNGALTYPVGLITSDEVMYAGGRGGTTNTTYYLYTNLNYCAGSPGQFYSDSADEVLVYGTGSIISHIVHNTSGLRPVISLRSSNSVSSGDGTSTNPYMIDVDNEYYGIYTKDDNKIQNINFDVNDSSYVKKGTTVTFKITPIDGYALDNIRIIDDNNNEVSFNSISNENEYRFIMPESDVTVIPSYKKNKFKVNIEIKNETDDFDINIENLTSVLVGENVIFKVTPIKGYKINTIKILDSNNNEVSYNSTENEYSFVMPESDVTIIPSYEKVSSSVNVVDNKHTKEIVIEVNNSKAVVYEDKVKFRVEPEAGYEVEKIEIKDKEDNVIEYRKTDKDNEYEFTMPDTDVIITPTYKKIELIEVPNTIKNPNTGTGMYVVISIIVLVFSLSIYLIMKKRKITL